MAATSVLKSPSETWQNKQLGSRSGKGTTVRKGTLFNLNFKTASRILEFVAEDLQESCKEFELTRMKGAERY